MNQNESDLHMSKVSDSLSGITIDLVVTGSIAAVDSLHLIRQIRSLGASVQVIMSAGSKLFVTEQSMEWASARRVISAFDGLSSHLAHSHFCIIAPGTASFLSKVASGICDHPATTIVQSHLGLNHLVMVLPCMHFSLDHSPIIQQTFATLKEKSLFFLPPRVDDGTLKFPSPELLARDIAHYYHRHHQKHPDHHRVLMNMGGTRGYWDPVRYIGNASSGELGTLLCHELYSFGFATHVVCGDAKYEPKSYSSFTRAETYDDMLAAMKSSFLTAVGHVICVAAILDYLPLEQHNSKISSEQSHVNLTLKASQKIRSFLSLKDQGSCHGIYQKILFKLGNHQITARDREAIFNRLEGEDILSMMIFNSTKVLTEANYEAHAIEKTADGFKVEIINSKRALAKFLRLWLQNKISLQQGSIQS
ncbi:MAG: hypothetical protein OXC40_01775 [Proteobacteria bacterium]|nr:hypothetical protein [Pseudomonadota bacterium]